MKLILKNGISLDIDNVSNRKNLAVNAGGKEPEQYIIFTIFNADEALVFEDLIETVKDNNADFSLTYGAKQKITYTGWALTDLGEEISDEQRKITLYATKTK